MKGVKTIFDRVRPNPPRDENKKTETQKQQTRQNHSEEHFPFHSHTKPNSLKILCKPFCIQQHFFSKMVVEFTAHMMRCLEKEIVFFFFAQPTHEDDQLLLLQNDHIKNEIKFFAVNFSNNEQTSKET
jgi:hypothetical protein